VIFTVEGEDRRYLHSTGANAEFSLDDVDFSLLDEARVLYVGGYLAMPVVTPQQLIRLFQEALRRGAYTVLDVVMPAGRSFGIDDIAGVLPWTNYFLPNQDEAHRLTGRSDARGQAECLSLISPDCAVVITCGHHGALAKRGSCVIQTPPFQVDTVDESGAGDAFTAGLIAGLLEDWGLERSVSFAAAVGASCTRAVGCSAGIFTFDEAVTFLERRTARVSGMER
jgi:sugar/nucleoside kinase (ribokinase family)